MSSADKFACKCGKEYDLNGSLFNHIRLKHNNDKFYLVERKVGRPVGVKNSIEKPKDLNKKPAKKLQCKCGDILTGEGALSNHIKLKHKNLPDYMITKKKQGRPKRGDIKAETTSTSSTSIDACVKTNESEADQSEVNTAIIEEQHLEKPQEGNANPSTLFNGDEDTIAHDCGDLISPQPLYDNFDDEENNYIVDNLDNQQLSSQEYIYNYDQQNNQGYYNPDSYFEDQQYNPYYQPVYMGMDQQYL